MIDTFSLLPGITLCCRKDSRFKQGCLTIQFVRPMSHEEAAYNALLPAVLLRGTENHRDLRAITEHLDTLYGASVSTLVRRVGDYQTVGLYCGFMDDRFALPGDHVLEPMIEFAEEILFEPLLRDGVFCEDIVESEKKNLIATIDAELNDKRAYAMGQMLKKMCQGDSYAFPRLGERDDVAAITPDALFAHYRTVLTESPIRIFYVGSATGAHLASLLAPLANRLGARVEYPLTQTAFSGGEPSDIVDTLDVAQGQLCMGFTTPITNRTQQFPAMQIFNTIFGGGMTSKLFMNVRERLSLCYSVGSGYYGSKGILTVSAGIDFDKREQTEQEILRQFESCRRGEISPSELLAAKEAVLSSLRATHDSPGAIEGYYATAALSGMGMTPAEYMQAVERVTLSDVVAAAATVQKHTTYFLKGVNR